MKEKKLFNAITDVNDEFVDEAMIVKLKKRYFTWQKLTAVVACATLIIGGVFMLSHGSNKMSGALVDVAFPKAYAFDDYDARMLTFTNNPVDDTFIAEINQFSYKTASQIITINNGNINYSPLSLYYALALVASGANGETEDEMLSLLGVSDKNTLSIQCGNLYRRLYSDNKIGKLKIANSLWIDSTISWKDDFVKNASENFYASTFSVDFSDNKTDEDMAKWILDNTNGVIAPELNISPEQILSIINTVYFYDEWVDKFNKANTAEDVFYLSDGTTVNCDFMNRTYSSVGFTKGDGFTRSSLGLKNAGQMVFILSDEGISPKELISTPQKMEAAFEEGEGCYGEVIWQIPKFSFGSKFDLVDMLKMLGINSAFKQDANFRDITDQTAFISNIRQETHIGIDENGVEAAAFTKIDYVGAALPNGRADMILNRPFIYGITASDGTLLFVGICDNPTAN